MSPFKAIGPCAYLLVGFCEFIGDYDAVEITKTEENHGRHSPWLETIQWQGGGYSGEGGQGVQQGRQGERQEEEMRTVATVFVILLLTSPLSQARDPDGRFANSPLKSWFDSLKSGKGPCCSDADGTALSDVDWEFKDNHYRVRIEGKWWDVPDDAVITEPNRAGVTMVWPVYLRGPTQEFVVNIRCFMPGTMS